MHDATAELLLRNGASREADAAVWLACFEPQCSRPEVAFHSEQYTEFLSRDAIECDLGAMWVDQMDPPLLSFTRSIDAALLLVEKIVGQGAEWDSTNLYGIARVSVGLNLSDGDERGEHKGGSVPIALCLAALKLAQRKGTTNASKTDYAGPKSLTSFGGELGEAPKESPLPDQKGLEKGGNSFGQELLDAGYDTGFGVTSLDTLLCEGMSRAERLDFAAFLIRAVQERFSTNAIPSPSSPASGG